MKQLNTVTDDGSNNNVRYDFSEASGFVALAVSRKRLRYLCYYYSYFYNVFIFSSGRMLQTRDEQTDRPKERVQLAGGGRIISSVLMATVDCQLSRRPRTWHLLVVPRSYGDRTHVTQYYPSESAEYETRCDAQTRKRHAEPPTARPCVRVHFEKQ